MKKTLTYLLTFVFLLQIFYLVSCDLSTESEKSKSGLSSSGDLEQGSDLNSDLLSDSLEKDHYIPFDESIDFDRTPLELNEKMNFIRREGDMLYDGDEPFRFISANTPSILNNLPFEQEDLVHTIAQMGGRVLRTYTFSIRRKNQSETVETYITEKGEYNEAAFKRLDQLLVYANKYNVRVIIPFIDLYTYTGGIPAFLELHGITPTRNMNQDATEFYSNKEVVDSFMDFVAYVVGRKNTISGVYYKDDPAILAWESGNELQGNMPRYNSWMRKLISTIKSIDTNHLILDGYFGVRPQALEDPDIDIVSNHFYSHINGTSFDQYAIEHREKTKGKKPFIIGEFGFEPVEEFEKFYDAIIEHGITGSLIWSIRGHDHKGGFYFHQENDRYSSYHWPGFIDGKKYEEIDTLRLTYLKAYEIQGKKPKLIPPPEPPEIIEPISNPALQIKWRGSTGAHEYEFQRSENPDGPWITIADKIRDSFMFAAIMFKDSDSSLVPGRTYYYRIRARSAGGESVWSQVQAGTIPED